MTKIIKQKAPCKKLHCEATKFYTGKWSIDGARVVLKWDRLPSMSLKTVDGGRNFHFTLNKEAKQYTCTTPPSLLTKLINSGVKEAQKKIIAAAGAKDPWFACQLAGGHERLVWTAKKLVIMTRTVKRQNCHKLNCKASRFYTGKWSIEGANVLLTWDSLPPMRLNSADGGLNFNSVFENNAKKYTCKGPPSLLTKLINAGINEAQQKLAAALRSKAGVPTDFSEHGCLDTSTQPVKADVLVLARGMTLAKCFTHCAKTKGMYYFALTRGDSCFCSATPPGVTSSPNNCDLHCSGHPEEYCGGWSTFASVYTMIDCLPPGPQEKREDAAARSKRLRALYSKKASQSCGQAKGNQVEVDGSPVYTGYPKDCEQMCLAGKGGGKCHGFTYDSKFSRCTFHLDAFWGNATKDPHSTCYYKKSIPLLG